MYTKPAEPARFPQRARSAFKYRRTMAIKPKKLSELLDPTVAKPVKGGLDPVVSRLAIDSRRVTPGSLFFALPGTKIDGNRFVDEAIARGAVAVVSSHARRFPSSKVAHVTVEDPRRALAYAARAFFDFPDKALALIGVTGTNGKTTVAFLARHLLSGCDRTVGCIGTVGYDLVKRTVPSFRTTPEAHDLCELMSQMQSFGCSGAVMEVSSHGIDQQRIAGMQFEIAAFLNLTRDHLDYHGDMESYYQVKKRLFTGELGNLPRIAVVNVDDPYGRRLLEEIPESLRVIRFGRAVDADLRAARAELTAEGSRFTAIWQDREFAVESPLIGHYNVSNTLAAFAICLASGVDLEYCIERLDTFDGIPGRMEKVVRDQDYTVLVDYAHTEDALRNALTMLREVTEGKLKVVFGCGGNRDRGKRPAMTAVAVELADYCWATSDNPRNESVEDIFEDMRAGAGDGSKIRFVPDRRRAIELALKSCEPGDCLLIAGKGHESFQEYGETVVPFDDRKVAAELLENIRIGGRG